MVAKKKSAATEANSTRLVIEGELTIYVAAELKEKIAALFACDAIEIDLAQVGEIDSAGLQLLLLAQRESERQQKSIVFSNPSAAVLDCWRVCNVGELFSGASEADAARESNAAH